MVLPLARCVGVAYGALPTSVQRRSGPDYQLQISKVNGLEAKTGEPRNGNFEPTEGKTAICAPPKLLPLAALAAGPPLAMPDPGNCAHLSDPAPPLPTLSPKAPTETPGIWTDLKSFAQLQR